MPRMLTTVRGRLTTWTAVVVGLVMIAAALGLYGLSRRALVSDVRETLTDNLTEARQVLDRGVATELSMLSLGVATDPLDQSARIADEECAPILRQAFGDERHRFADFYFLFPLDNASYVAYDDCLQASDPLYEALFVCDQRAIDAIGNPVVTFDEYWEIYTAGEFDAARDECFEEALIDPRIDEAAAECDLIVVDAYEGVDVLDDEAVARATESALDEYSECMRANGIADYPDLTASQGEDGSVLSGVTGSAVVIPSLESVRAGLERFGLGMAVGVPLLLLLLVLLTWLVVGRALAPVEAIRARVDEIGAEELDRRVPMPGTDDEIDRLAVTMNSMLGRLERSASRQRQFVSDASHELRSPLASIRAQLEVALAHPEHAQWEQVGTGVLAEGSRMERLVDDLLALARLDEGVPAAHREPVDLSDLLLDEATHVTAERVDVSGVSPATVVGDPHALRRVLRNLLDNAARHAEGSIAVASAVEDGGVLVTVDDDGAGIAPGDRDRVFERFTRLEEARTRDAGGAGLGLAVVREVLAAHGGSVEIVDSPLGGARFRVRLPADPGSAG